MILDALTELEFDPYAGYALRGRFSERRALRVDSYRLLYRLEDRDQTVVVLDLRHRSSAYTDPP